MRPCPTPRPSSRTSPSSRRSGRVGSRPSSGCGPGCRPRSSSSAMRSAATSGRRPRARRRLSTCWAGRGHGQPVPGIRGGRAAHRTGRQVGVHSLPDLECRRGRAAVARSGGRSSPGAPAEPLYARVARRAGGGVRAGLSGWWSAPRRLPSSRRSAPSRPSWRCWCPGSGLRAARWTRSASWPRGGAARRRVAGWGIAGQRVARDRRRGLRAGQVGRRGRATRGRRRRVGQAASGSA